MLLFSILVFASSVAFAAIYAFHKKAKLLDPITIFLGFFALMVLPLPVRWLFTDVIDGDISPFLPNFAPYFPAALLLCSVSLPFFVWGYYSGVSRWLAERLPAPGSPKVSRFFQPFFKFDRSRFAAVVICAGSLGLVYELARSAGVNGILGFLLLGYNSTAQMFGKGYLAAGIPWFFVGSLFFLYRYSFMRQMYENYRARCAAEKTKPLKAKWLRVDLLIFATLFVVQLGAMIVMGDRHSLMNYVLVAVIFWHFAIRRISFKKVAVIAVLGFLSLNLLGYLRGSRYEDLGAFSSAASDRYRDSDNNAFFYTLTTGEFVVPFETMPQIIRTLGSDRAPCQWGMTYLRAPLYFVPQAVYPDRPLPLANWYMAAFYGGGWRQNEGRQFFFLSEGYLNFGPAGVLLAMGLWGLFLGVLNQYRKLNSGNKGVVLLFALITAFLFRCISGDSVSLLVALPEQFLLVAVVGLILAGGVSYRDTPVLRG